MSLKFCIALGGGLIPLHPPSYATVSPQMPRIIEVLLQHYFFKIFNQTILFILFYHSLSVQLQALNRHYGSCECKDVTSFIDKIAFCCTKLRGGRVIIQDARRALLASTRFCCLQATYVSLSGRDLNLPTTTPYLCQAPYPLDC